MPIMILSGREKPPMVGRLLCCVLVGVAMGEQMWELCVRWGGALRKDAKGCWGPGEKGGQGWLFWVGGISVKS